MSKTQYNRSHLVQQLRDLRLPEFRENFEELAKTSKSSTVGYEEYLQELANLECDARRTNRIESALRKSRLPREKTLAAFDLKRLPAKVGRQVRSLLDGSFVDRQENVLAFGRPGSGKTHLLTALSHELIHQGRRVYFRPCSLLVQELLVAKRDLKLPRVLQTLGRYDAIMIDDIGYVQQSREEMEVLFTLLADRYERTSILLTSNLPFGKWESIFKDAMTTAAAIDRLVHHSVILELNTKSYRLEDAQKGKRAQAAS